MRQFLALALLWVLMVPYSQANPCQSGLSVSFRQLHAALASFHQDCGVYPKSLDSLIKPVSSESASPELASCWQGPYLSTLPVDHLGNTFQLQLLSEAYGHPRLYSAGADGVAGNGDDILSLDSQGRQLAYRDDKSVEHCAIEGDFHPGLVAVIALLALIAAFSPVYLLFRADKTAGKQPSKRSPGEGGSAMGSTDGQANTTDPDMPAFDMKEYQEILERYGLNSDTLGRLDDLANSVDPVDPALFHDRELSDKELHDKELNDKEPEDKEHQNKELQRNGVQDTAQQASPKDKPSPPQGDKPASPD